jgi:hypothetical protein
LYDKKSLINKFVVITRSEMKIHFHSARFVRQ